MSNARYRIEWFKSTANGKYHWRVREENCEIILSSQGVGLKDKDSMLATISNLAYALGGSYIGIFEVDAPMPR